jgi:GntP family gluconate:H+ symporter
LDKANVDGNGCKVSEKSSWFEIVMNNMGRAVRSTSPSVLCSSQLWVAPWVVILRENEAIQTHRQRYCSHQFPGDSSAVPAGSHFDDGLCSMTTDSMTAAGLMAALVPVLGMSPWWPLWPLVRVPWWACM